MFVMMTPRRQHMAQHIKQEERPKQQNRSKKIPR
jgi:hypothetical protein